MRERLIPSQLWKRMTSVQRLASARAFWTDNEAADDQLRAALLCQDPETWGGREEITKGLKVGARG